MLIPLSPMCRLLWVGAGVGPSPKGFSWLVPGKIVPRGAIPPHRPCFSFRPSSVLPVLRKCCRIPGRLLYPPVPPLCILSPWFGQPPFPFRSRGVFGPLVRSNLTPLSGRKLNPRVLRGVFLPPFPLSAPLWLVKLLPVFLV